MFVIYKVFFILYMINKRLLKRPAGVPLQRGGDETRVGRASRKGRGAPGARMRLRLPGEAEAGSAVHGAMAAGGGLSRSERKAAERVRRLREEQQRERLRQVGYRRARDRTRACNRSPLACPQVSRILRKAAAERSAEEGRLLAESEDLVTELQGRSRRREGLKRRQEEASPGRRAAGCRRRAAAHMTSPGSPQVCDDPEELRRKVRELAGAVRNAKHLVVYTGAGISTVGAGLRAGSGVGRPLLGHKLGLRSAGVG